MISFHKLRPFEGDKNHARQNTHGPTLKYENPWIQSASQHSSCETLSIHGFSCFSGHLGVFTPRMFDIISEESHIEIVV